jgi:hypothetical protein
MRKCIECETELEDSTAIIYHACEAYPKPDSKEWWQAIKDDLAFEDKSY